MPAIAVVGAQWGDEGKGKIVDVLTANADVVVRFQGGNNAGHTIVVDGVKTALSLLPSGILRPHMRCFLAAGVVLNPSVLLAEIERVRSAGALVTPERLVIDYDVHLVLDYHIALDKERERVRSKFRIGTTGRGIGPAYEDRYQRTGIRAADFLDLSTLRDKIAFHVEEKNKTLKFVLGSDLVVDFETVWQKLESDAKTLIPFLGSCGRQVENALVKNERVVFEGAQGVLLDVIHGTYPYVTSSSTLAASALTSCGLGVKTIDSVLGVAKAYCTRVGEGPFPSEMHGEVGDEIRARGHEFGTITGRPRRCGWFDVVAMRRAVRLSGIDTLVLTKLDVLSGLRSIKLCTSYQLNGSELDDLPPLATQASQLIPQYQEVPGWTDTEGEQLARARKYSEMPVAARHLVETIESLIGVKVGIVSVGPGREATILNEKGSDPSILTEMIRDFIAS